MKSAAKDYADSLDRLTREIERLRDLLAKCYRDDRVAPPVETARDVFNLTVRAYNKNREMRGMRARKLKVPKW